MENLNQIATQNQRYKSQTWQRLILPLLVVGLMTGMSFQNAKADVLAQISSREAYVGSPVTFYIQVSGAELQSEPEIPEVDGLDIRRAGAPSRSSRVTIINGRRSEFSSTVYTFQVTPRRAGNFEIPSIEIKTPSGAGRTQSVRFVATKSETGDLMFAEIEGNGDRVFVGQPIESTLKIWIKPFVDRRNGIKLTPDQMWQLMSEQSEWGGFRSTLDEMMKNGQRVRGRAILRKDGDGIEREYYLYEVDATIYPKSAGALDAKDVQIVYQYPLALGESRDPFESFFDDSLFGGSSLSRQFFGNGSPFGRSLTVTDARPIVVEPESSDFEVLSIPKAGQPSDYRGAVGKYVIATQASPVEVKAGDPITLQIGVRGTGPMELVQAPPLHTIPSLTEDFKVADESLAGVVQGDVKVFVTTIRPRNESVTQIPAIPFSYFDPEPEQFITVQSDPISIKVDEAETLTLNSIIGDGAEQAGRPQATKNEPRFSLENDEASSVLRSTNASSPTSVWWIALIPPGIGFVTVLRSWRIQPRSHELARLIREVKRAQSSTALADVVQRAQSESGNSMESSLLRSIPDEFPADLKCAIRDLYKECDEFAYATEANRSLSEIKKQAIDVLRGIATQNHSGGKLKILQIDQPVRMAMSLGLAVILIAVTVFAYTEITKNQRSKISFGDALFEVTVQLGSQQQDVLLEEASQAYANGQSLEASDVAESKLAFQTASEKYQLLVDSGVRNSALYRNLGNSYLQQGNLGKAIANYESAKRLNPFDFDAANNLKMTRELLADSSEESTSVATGMSFSDGVQRVVSMVPNWSVLMLFGTGWFTYWAVNACHWYGSEVPMKFSRRLVVISAALVLFTCGWGIADSRMEVDRGPTAVITSAAVDVRVGCGDEFEINTGMNFQEGASCRVIQKRGDWCQVESANGSEGWVRTSALEFIPSV